MKFISFNRISGDYTEFGCASAKTFRMCYNLIKQYRLGAKLWAFDSFKGLPPARDDRDLHPQWTLGNYPTPAELFSIICNHHGIPRSDYHMVAGFWEDTIGPNRTTDAEFTKYIAFANIDCDMHSSTADVLFFLKDRMKERMIIYFDDYYCYADGRKSGERQAMIEFLQENPDWRFEHYHSVGWHGRAFIVEKA